MSDDDFPIEREGYSGKSWLSRREFAALLGLVPPGGSFLEVGSASGVTAAMVADARPTGRVVGVDALVDVEAEHVTGTDGDRRVNLWRNRRPNLSFWLGTFADFALLSAGVRFDVALVDADHEYRPTLEAVHFAAGHLKAGGVIACHDFGNPYWPDVEPAVRYFAASHCWTVEPLAGLLCTLRRDDSWEGFR